MRTAARTDSTHREIMDALVKGGASVTSLASIGKGCPDLLVGVHGRTYLIEVKTQKGKLTPDQAWWHSEWRGGDLVILRSVDEAMRFVDLAGRAVRLDTLLMDSAIREYQVGR